MRDIDLSGRRGTEGQDQPTIGGAHWWQRLIVSAANSPLTRLVMFGTLATLISLGMLTAMVTCCRRLEPGSSPIRIAPIVLALVLYMAYIVLNAYGWTRVLKLLDAPIKTAVGIRLWVKCEACRWIPGGVWNFGARSMAVTRHNVSLLAGTASLAVELLFAIASWAVIAGLATLSYRSAMRDGLQRLPPIVWQLAPWAVALLVLLTGMAAVLRWRGRQGHGGRNPVGGALAALRLHPRKACWLVLYYLGINCFHGLALYAVVMAWNPDCGIPLMAVLGGNAIAWLVGFFVVFAPGGIIVREATLTVVLASWLPLPAAASVAIAWRMLQLAGEFILLATISVWESGSWTRPVTLPTSADYKSCHR